MKRFVFICLILFSTFATFAQDGLGLTQPLQLFRVSEPVTSIDVTTDGQKLAVADRHCVSIFNFKSGQLERAFEEETRKLRKVQFYPDYKSILINQTVRSLGNGSFLNQYVVDSEVIARVSRKSKLLALGMSGRRDSPSNGMIYIVRWPNPEKIIAEFGTEFRSNGLVSHADGVPFALDISPDEAKVIEGCQTGNVYLWNINSTPQSNPLLGFKAHSDIINSIQFNPANGNQILTASWDGTAKLWDLTTKKLLRIFKHDVGGIKCAIFSPDGRFVLTGGSDNTARLWRTATGAKALAFHGHDQPVSCVAFTPDGRRVLTGSWDHTVRVWPVPRK